MGQRDQFARLESCSSAVVDNCTFAGGHENLGLRPRRAVKFLNCHWSRFSNNHATDMIDEMARYDAGCLDSVELCNWEVQTDPPPTPTIPRIVLEAGIHRFMGMSRRAMGIPFLAVNSDLPGAGQVTPGALAWVEETTKLKVWDGNQWRDVTYS